MSSKDLPYRRNVGAAVFNRDGRVFIGRRRKQREGMEVVSAYEWQMPQGGVDEGEAPLETARRELFEETNISSVTLLAELPDWLSYDLPPEALTRRWKGRCSRPRSAIGGPAWASGRRWWSSARARSAGWRCRSTPWSSVPGRAW